MTQKGLAPIAIVLIIAAVLGGYLLYQNQNKTSQQSTEQPTASPTTDETANWKTYTNTENGFSLQYPPDWNIITNPQGTPYPITLQSSNYEYDEKERVEEVVKSGAKINLGVQSGSSYSDPIIEGKIIKGTDTTTDKKIFNVSKLIIDGQSAVRYDFQSVQTATLMGTNVEIPRSNKYVFIGMLYSSPSYKETLNQILSTFKFTN